MGWIHGKPLLRGFCYSIRFRRDAIHMVGTLDLAKGVILIAH